MVASSYKRIVIKIGSSLLVSAENGLKQAWLESLADDVSKLRDSGSEVIIVSSGAIALGRGLLGLQKKSLKLEENQASAAVGQIQLSRAYAEAFGKYNNITGQVLLTLSDTEQRRRYLNARETMFTLLKLGAIPIINENDTVATSEIRYGDNDRLAARVATMAGADLLILLSDVDGLYTAAPGKDPTATHIERVREITPEIVAMAGDAGTELSRGGMRTKIEAAKIATAAGTSMVITSGHQYNPVAGLFDGQRATWFDARDTPVKARKKWIGGQIEIAGEIVVDAGAASALERGKSLLPAGVTAINGTFSRGDAVAITSTSGLRLGCGLVAYDAADAKKITGLKSSEIESVLGYPERGAMIHRDNLVLQLHGSTLEQDNA